MAPKEPAPLPKRCQYMENSLLVFAHWASAAFEAAGITVILIGSVVAIFGALRSVLAKHGSDHIVAQFRRTLGRSILLGLEFLVAGDIINTVAFEPTLKGVAVLASIVAIRTFLSFSLELEIEGRWPWEKNKADDKGGAGPSSSSD